MGDTPPGARPTTNAGHGRPARRRARPKTATRPQRAQGGASRTEALQDRDFAEWLPQDMDRFEPLVEALKRRLRTRLTRRWRRHRGSGAIDLRRTLRASLPTGGELVKLHHVRRQRRQPRVFMLVDVSRSMETHAQLFLRMRPRLRGGHGRTGLCVPHPSGRGHAAA